LILFKTFVMQILHGDCISVLRGMKENSIDTIYTCPSPFAYYEKGNESMIGGERKLVDYIQNLIDLCNTCKRVLKETGNLFIQIADIYVPPKMNLAGIPAIFEHFMNMNGWYLNDRLLWHRTETTPRKFHERGFLKNYEFIFHYVKDIDQFYINTSSKYIKTSVFSYPIEDTYYTNEFDSGLPEELTRIIIDTTVPKNGIILDPLCGSAKVGVVAKKMNRDFIGIDINLETVEAARIRLGI
jgi:DNA modification methylase